MKQIVCSCPICNNTMVATTLKCSNCDIEIKGEFEIPELDSNKKISLSDEDEQFIKSFIKYEGNIKKTGEELGLDYIEMKEKLKEINIILGNGVENKMNNLEYLDSTGKEKASKRIIECLNGCGGTAYCTMLKGEDIQIWLTPTGVTTSSVKDYVYKWEEFDAIVEKAKALGGKMYKGDSAAQRGDKIGSAAFPVDTIDAFIAIKFYGQTIGDTVFRRSTYYAAILKWAGICTNNRSDGFGGYIELLPNWK